MPQHQILRIFRLEDGVRIPYTIELDHELTVVAEYADRTVQRHVAEGRGARRPRPEMAPVKKKNLLLGRWVSESVADNPIDGTGDLREAYFADKRALLASFDERDEPCPPCQLGRLMRRYREKLEAGGHFSNIAEWSP